MSWQIKHIAIVDDDASVRDALEAVLDSWGYRTSAFADAESFLADGLEVPPDCLLLDVRMPKMDGLDLISDLRRRGIALPVLMMSAHGDVSTAVEAMRRGAQDFIEKPFDDRPLVERIEALSTLPLGLVPDPQARALLDTLTPRETQVLDEVVAGFANKVVAHRLGISLKTVEMHRARVMQKTGAKTLAHLVRIAIAAGHTPGRAG
ncbi:MAG: response regulator transcription factor [Paracoccaceae bacterium]